MIQLKAKQIGVGIAFSYLVLSQTSYVAVADKVKAGVPIDLSVQVGSLQSALKGNHHFSPEEKVFSYEHVYGPAGDNARKLLMQGMQQHFDHKDVDALKSYDLAIKESPKYVPTYIEKAALLADLKKETDAIKVCEQILSVDKNSLPGLHLEGLCYSELKEYGKSIPLWTKSIAIEPKDGVAYTMRSKDYMAEGKKIEAHQDEDKAKRLALPRKIGILVSQGDTAQAIKELHDAVKTYPDDFEVRMAEITFLMKMHKDTDAIKSCVQTAKRFPEAKGVTSYLQGKSYAATHDFRKATDSFSDAITHFDHMHTSDFKGNSARLEMGLSRQFHEYVLLARAQAYRNSKSFDKAKADVNAYLKENPKSKLGYDELGLIYETQGDKKSALAQYKLANKLDGQDRQSSDGITRLAGASDIVDQLTGIDSKNVSKDKKH